MEPIPRSDRIAAMRAVTEATGAGAVAFAWSWRELLLHLATARRGAAAPWPSREGRLDRWMARAARSVLVRGILLAAASVAERLQRLAIRVRRREPLVASVSGPPPTRAFLVFGAANEGRIAAWRQRERPMTTVRLGTGVPGAIPLPRPAGRDAAALHRSLGRDLRRALAHPALASGGRVAALAARLSFLRRVPAFLATVAALDDLAAAGAVGEVVTSTLDERAFAVGRWAAGRGVPAIWVQHGFLALDVLPYVPGLVHHAYDEDHAAVAASCGAPPEALAPPIGLAYFARSRLEPRRTLLLASQGRIPFALPIGRGCEAGTLEAARAACEAGWRVVQRPHRVETEGTFARHEVEGAEVLGGAGTLAEVLAEERPAFVLSVWSTAALDAAAAGLGALFVCSREGMAEHSVSDLSRHGTVLDPASPDFGERVRALFSPRGAPAARAG